MSDEKLLEGVREKSAKMLAILKECRETAGMCDAEPEGVMDQLDTLEGDLEDLDMEIADALSALEDDEEAADEEVPDAQ